MAKIQAENDQVLHISSLFFYFPSSSDRRGRQSLPHQTEKKSFLKEEINRRSRWIKSCLTIYVYIITQMGNRFDGK
jgi:hypothetical protein